MKLNVLAVVKRSPLVFPVALAAAVAMVAISEFSYWQSVGSLNDLGAMGAARTTLQGLQQSILDAESGQRGYVLSGRAEQLASYENALREIDRDFEQLARYYEGEVQPQATLMRLRGATDVLLADLAASLRPPNEGLLAGRSSAKVADESRRQMNAVRALGAELLQHEAGSVAASRSELYRTLWMSRAGVALLSVLCLAALYGLLRQSLALDRQHLEQQRLAQGARERLEQEVRLRTAQLTELAQHLQTAREDERGRLARDMHDELGALLTSAKLDAARIRSRLAGAAPEAQERLAHLVETLNGVIALKRRIIEDLRPSALGHLGLAVTLEIVAREFAERSGVAVHCDLSPVRLVPSAEIVAYRLVQEAITNITKHAGAHTVWVGLREHGDRVEVSVRDDGAGFDTAAQAGSAYGLVGMRFRVEAEHGTLTIVSTPGQGTLVRAVLPRALAPMTA
jgi:signal transduction histidine kinase